jgi:hypothetical protein
MPTNVGLDRFGFVKDAYRRILSSPTLTSGVAARFRGQDALLVHQAIRDAVSNIKVETPSPETVFDGMGGNDCGFIMTSKFRNGSKCAGMILARFRLG